MDSHRVRRFTYTRTSRVHIHACTFLHSTRFVTRSRRSFTLLRLRISYRLPVVHDFLRYRCVCYLLILPLPLYVYDLCLRFCDCCCRWFWWLLLRSIYLRYDCCLVVHSPTGRIYVRCSTVLHTFGLCRSHTLRYVTLFYVTTHSRWYICVYVVVVVTFVVGYVTLISVVVVVVVVCCCCCCWLLFTCWFVVVYYVDLLRYVLLYVAALLLFTLHCYIVDSVHYVIVIGDTLLLLMLYLRLLTSFVILMYPYDYCYRLLHLLLFVIVVGYCYVVIVVVIVTLHWYCCCCLLLILLRCSLFHLVRWLLMICYVYGACWYVVVIICCCCCYFITYLLLLLTLLRLIHWYVVCCCCCCYIVVTVIVVTIIICCCSRPVVTLLVLHSTCWLRLFRFTLFDTVDLVDICCCYLLELLLLLVTIVLLLLPFVTCYPLLLLCNFTTHDLLGCLVVCCLVHVVFPFVVVTLLLRFIYCCYIHLYFLYGDRYHCCWLLLVIRVHCWLVCIGTCYYHRTTCYSLPVVDFWLRCNYLLLRCCCCYVVVVVVTLIQLVIVVDVRTTFVVVDTLLFLIRWLLLLRCCCCCCLVVITFDCCCCCCYVDCWCLRTLRWFWFVWCVVVAVRYLRCCYVTTIVIIYRCCDLPVTFTFTLLELRWYYYVVVRWCVVVGGCYRSPVVLLLPYVDCSRCCCCTVTRYSVGVTLLFTVIRCWPYCFYVTILLSRYIFPTLVHSVRYYDRCSPRLFTTLLFCYTLEFLYICSTLTGGGIVHVITIWLMPICLILVTVMLLFVYLLLVIRCCCFVVVTYVVVVIVVVRWHCCCWRLVDCWFVVVIGCWLHLLLIHFTFYCRCCYALLICCCVYVVTRCFTFFVVGGRIVTLFTGDVNLLILPICCCGTIVLRFPFMVTLHLILCVICYWYVTRCCCWLLLLLLCYWLLLLLGVSLLLLLLTFVDCCWFTCYRCYCAFVIVVVIRFLTLLLPRRWCYTFLTLPRRALRFVRYLCYRCCSVLPHYVTVVTVVALLLFVAVLLLITLLICYPFGCFVIRCCCSRYVVVIRALPLRCYDFVTVTRCCVVICSLPLITPLLLGDIHCTVIVALSLLLLFWLLRISFLSLHIPYRYLLLRFCYLTLLHGIAIDDVTLPHGEILFYHCCWFHLLHCAVICCPHTTVVLCYDFVGYVVIPLLQLVVVVVFVTPLILLLPRSLSLPLYIPKLTVVVHCYICYCIHILVDVVVTSFVVVDVFCSIPHLYIPFVTVRWSHSVTSRYSHLLLFCCYCPLVTLPVVIHLLLPFVVILFYCCYCYCCCYYCCCYFPHCYLYIDYIWLLITLFCWPLLLHCCWYCYCCYCCYYIDDTFTIPDLFVVNPHRDSGYCFVVRYSAYVVVLTALPFAFTVAFVCCYCYRLPACTLPFVRYTVHGRYACWFPPPLLPTLPRYVVIPRAILTHPAIPCVAIGITGPFYISFPTFPRSPVRWFTSAIPLHFCCSAFYDIPRVGVVPCHTTCCWFCSAGDSRSSYAICYPFLFFILPPAVPAAFWSFYCDRLLFVDPAPAFTSLVTPPRTRISSTALRYRSRVCWVHRFLLISTPCSTSASITLLFTFLPAVG